jgi:ribose 5-phosphate isomerase B
MMTGVDMRIAVGADHGGYSLKAEIIQVLTQAGQRPIDLGAHNLDPADDYPDFAEAVGRAIQAGQAERGIVVCGSGVGACVAANKLKGIRAAICHDTYSAHQGVEHDNMNVLCLGARIIGSELTREIVLAFAGAQFSGEERHVRRLNKVLKIEREE